MSRLDFPPEDATLEAKAKAKAKAKVLEVHSMISKTGRGFRL